MSGGVARSSLRYHSFHVKFLTDFSYRNLHGFARFPGDSTALVLIAWLSNLSPKRITVVDIGGYEQPKSVLVSVTLSFTFNLSNNFYCRSGYKADKKMAMVLSKL